MSDNNLKPHQLKLEMHGMRAFVSMPQAGTTRKEVLEKSFWPTIANQLRPGDEVRVVPEDQAFYMKVYVRFVNGSDVAVEEIEYREFGETNFQINEHPDYTVMNGGAAGFYIKNVKTGEKVLNKYFAKRHLAYKALDEYLNKLHAA